MGSHKIFQFILVEVSCLINIYLYLFWMSYANSKDNNTYMVWFLFDFLSLTIYLLHGYPIRRQHTNLKLLLCRFKVKMRNFKVNNFKLKCWLCRVVWFGVSLCTNMAWKFKKVVSLPWFVWKHSCKSEFLWKIRIFQRVTDPPL